MTGKPKPTQLKALEGNRGKRPLPENEPNPYPMAPDCPEYLDEFSKEAWNRLSPMLEKLGLLTEADGDEFATLCQVIGRLKAIRLEINKPEVKILMLTYNVDSYGNEKVSAKINPLFVEERQLQGQLRQFASEFGLTPRGRVGLSVGKSKGDEGGELI